MFDRPLLLWLLALAPVAIAPSIIAIRNGRKLAGLLSAVLRLGCFAVLVAMLAGLRISAIAAARHVEVVALLDHSSSIAPDQRDWMRRQLSALKSALASGDQLGVIAFGRNARLLSPLSDPRLVRDSGATPDAGATNLEDALTAAQSLFSADADRRILLLSDGNETEGSSNSETAALREDGVGVFTAAPPLSKTHRVAVTDFTSPALVRARQQFSFALNIESESPEPIDAQLRLLSDGNPVGGQHFRLHPGLNRLELPYRIDRPGAYVMSAEIAVPAPVETINPRADAPLSVIEPPRVLVASESRPESLISALRMRGYQADLVTPRSLSAQATDYLPYQLVIIDDAASGTITDGVQQALSHYVADYGGGLVLAGEALRDDHFRGGPLEKTLPVKFEQQPPPPTREPIAVYLCIDRSNSMSYDSRYPAVRDGERIRYAKQAAVALLRQLDDSDYAGVIAFDSEPYVLGHLQPLSEDRADLESRIDRLQPGGGTDFKEALEIAQREILQSGVAVRQVILLTDGDTNRQYHDHDELIGEMANNHIPVSTIRIGPDLENLRLLQDFAQATGGVFYRVQDIEKLPLMLVGLTREAMNRRKQGRTSVQAGAPSQILSGISINEIPPIDFYASTTPKDGAQVPLTITRGDKSVPLLAGWQYGLGRSAIFAADPDSLASLSWIRWDRYAEFWSQLAQWTMRQGDPGFFTLRVAPTSDGSVTIEAESADSSPVTNLVCRVTGPRRAVDVALTPSSSSVYTGEVGALARGKYTATLMIKAGDTERVLMQREFASTGIAPADAAELRLRPANLELLRHLAGATQGGFNAPAIEIARHRGRTVRVRRSADFILLPLAILLFLGEVGVRRRLLGD